jgi:hypothetical protein
MSSAHNKKRLGTYVALAGTYLTIPLALDAQVNYIDVDPDIDLGSVGTMTAVFALDIDENGTFDYQLTRVMSSGPGSSSFASSAFIQGLGSNEVMVDTLIYGLANDPGTKINAAANWALLADLGNYSKTSTDTVSNGPWVNAADKFLGLRFQDAVGDLHYAWMRLDFSEGFADGLIKDQAYQVPANKAIRAGRGIACSAPANPNAVVGIGSVELSWEANPIADEYGIFGRPLGAPSFRSFTSTEAIVNISGLDEGESFEWEVRVACLDGNISEATPLDTFTTLCMRDWEGDWSDIQIYNSASSIFIALDEEQDGMLLRLFDLNGRLVLSQVLSGGMNQIDLRGDRSSMYLIADLSGNGVQRRFKLVASTLR